MKKIVIGIATSFLIGAAVNANAALIQIDFTASGDWFYEDLENNTSAYESPDLRGTFILDNTRADLSAIVSANIDGLGNHYSQVNHEFGYDGDVFHYDNLGNLENFEYLNFTNGGNIQTDMAGFDSYSFAEMGDSRGWFHCDGTCITFTQTEIEDLPPATDVPEPGTLALFGIGSLGLAFARKRKKL